MSKDNVVNLHKTLQKNVLSITIFIRWVSEYTLVNILDKLTHLHLPLIRNLNKLPSVPSRIKTSEDLHDINNHTVSTKLFSQNHGMEFLPQEKGL